MGRTGAAGERRCAVGMGEAVGARGSCAGRFIGKRGGGRAASIAACVGVSLAAVALFAAASGLALLLAGGCAIGLLVVGASVALFVGGGRFHLLLHRGSSSAVARRRHQPDKRQTRAMIRGKLPLVLVNGILLNGIVGAGIAFSSGRWGAAYWH